LFTSVFGVIQGILSPQQQRNSIFENIQRRGASLAHVATRIPQKQPHPFANLGVAHVAALLGQCVSANGARGNKHATKNVLSGSQITYP
jgi:hypothetical protein